MKPNKSKGIREKIAEYASKTQSEYMHESDQVYILAMLEARIDAIIDYLEEKEHEENI